MLLGYLVAFIRQLDLKDALTTPIRSAFLQHVPQQQSCHGNSATETLLP